MWYIYDIYVDPYLFQSKISILRVSEKCIWLVVTGTWMDYDFPETVGNVIIPTDWLIFFRGLETTNQCTICLHTNMCILELPVDLYMITYVYMYLYRYQLFLFVWRVRRHIAVVMDICQSVYIYTHMITYVYIHKIYISMYISRLHLPTLQTRYPHCMLQLWYLFVWCIGILMHGQFESW